MVFNKIRLILAAATLVLITLAYFYGRSAGYDACVADSQKAADKHKAEERENITLAEDAVERIEVRYEEKVKYIWKAADPTGCADTKLSDIGLYQPTDNR